MTEKLQDILNDYDEQISRYEKQYTDLQSRLSFFSEHKFEEEARITRLKVESIDMIVYRFRNMHKEVSELLNGWMS